MTPLEEHSLYLSDIHAWARHVAPRRLAKMRTSEDEKRRLWRTAGPELRAEIRRLVELEK